MKKFILTIGMLMMLAIQSVNVAFADEQVRSELKEVEVSLVEVLEDDATATNCRAKLVPIYDVEMLQFIDFMEENFQNKSANSELVNTAIARYRQLKKALEDHLSKLEPRVSGDNTSIFTNELQAFESCTEITVVYMELAKDRLFHYVHSTNYQKKTTAFEEKYQSINGKLRDLNLQLADTYGFFMTFKNKLPGFLSQCIVQ